MEGRHLQLRILFILFCCCCGFSSVQSTLRKPLNGTLQSDRLTSGPIFLIDHTTVLVTKFAYDNGKTKNVLKKHNKWFKGIVRRGDNITSYVDLHFKNQTNAQLTENLYLGLNIYLHIPMDSAFDFQHLAAIAIVNDKNVTKTSVPIDVEDIIDLPVRDENYMYKNGSFVFVYPKCCPFDSYFNKEEKCINQQINEANFIKERIPVHEVRMDNNKYNANAMKINRIAYEPFYDVKQCRKSPFLFRFDLTDNLTLLSNTEVMLHGEERPKLACLEYILDENKRILSEGVYICAEDLDVDLKLLKTSSAASVSTLKPTVLLFVIITILVHTS